MPPVVPYDDQQPPLAPSADEWIPDGRGGLVLKGSPLDPNRPRVGVGRTVAPPPAPGVIEPGSPLDMAGRFISETAGRVGELMSPKPYMRAVRGAVDWLTRAPAEDRAPLMAPVRAAGRRQEAADPAAVGAAREKGSTPTAADAAGGPSPVLSPSGGHVYDNADLARVKAGGGRGGYGTFETPETQAAKMDEDLMRAAAQAAQARYGALVKDPTGAETYRQRKAIDADFAQKQSQRELEQRNAALAQYRDNVRKAMADPKLDPTHPFAQDYAKRNNIKPEEVRDHILQRMKDDYELDVQATDPRARMQQ